MHVQALAVAVLTMAAFLSIPAMPAVSASEFVVNSTGDGPDVNTGDGICDDGTAVPPAPANCTLRAAIEEANATPGDDAITLNVAGDGQQRIAPASPLPDITDTLTIDGSAQPQGIVLTGTNAGAGADGLRFFTTGSTVRDIIIEEFGGAGIHFVGGGSNVVEGSRLGNPVGGLRTTGAQSLNGNTDGVLLNWSPGNVIGGTSAAAGNVITGNGYSGIRIIGASSIGTLIQGNYIGTDPTGIPNSANQFGIWIDEGGGSVIASNVISGNTYRGVSINGGTGNFIEGNRIGSNAAGDTALSNETGIYIANSTHNIIGGFGTSGNLISGNRSQGISLWFAEETEILGNYVGTNAAGTAALSNGYGIYSEQGWANTIGGTDSRARNLISGNYIGVEINNNGPVSGANAVQGNYIGTNATGTVGLYTQQEGVIINGSNGNLIGGTTPGAGNLISGNNGAGIRVCCSGNTGNIIQGNYIGTDVSGKNAVYNSTGIHLQSAGGTLIGGPTAAARNVISGNGTGVSLEYGADGNSLLGNYIGTDASGVERIGNQAGHTGVLISNANGNIVGGVSPGEGNIVAYNEYAGVWVYGFPYGAERNTIRGNSVHSNGNEGIKNEYGANLELPPPVMIGKGAISGTACADCTVDVYSDNEDEGRVFHGSTVADASGKWSFGGATGGPNLTATATDGGGNTSEFSAAVLSPFCSHSDSDCDRVFDDDENWCESDPFNASSRPERLDGPFAGVDDDGDGQVDEVIHFERSYNADCDGDGYDGGVEFKIGTGDQDACGVNGWPSDLVAGGLRVNTLNIEDFGSFLVPVRRLDSRPGDAAFDARWDLGYSPDSVIVIDIVDMAALVTGKRGYPPMFGGQRALGRTCPWAP